jgi:hypothetical protein
MYRTDNQAAEVVNPATCINAHEKFQKKYNLDEAGWEKATPYQNNHTAVKSKNILRKKSSTYYHHNHTNYSIRVVTH